MKWLLCRILGHRWKFKLLNLEKEKVFVCDRCDKAFFV
jgi:hypothetical protein